MIWKEVSPISGMVYGLIGLNLYNGQRDLDMIYYVFS